MSNVFKVNNKDTRVTSVVSLASLALLFLLHFILLLLLLNLSKYWLGLRIYNFRQKNLFSVTARNLFWATCFHCCSPNIRLRKDKFSRQRFKKISRLTVCLWPHTAKLCNFVCVECFLLTYDSIPSNLELAL